MRRVLNRIRMIVFLTGVVISLSACAHAKRLDAIETVKVVERLVPVPTPCDKKVTRPAATVSALGVLEDRVEALTGADAQLRSYVAQLEAAALACGVGIK